MMKLIENSFFEKKYPADLHFLLHDKEAQTDVGEVETIFSHPKISWAVSDHSDYVTKSPSIDSIAYSKSFKKDLLNKLVGYRDWYDHHSKEILGHPLTWILMFVIKWAMIIASILLVTNEPFDVATAIGWIYLVLSIFKAPVDILETVWIFTNLLRIEPIRNELYYFSLFEAIKLRIFLTLSGLYLMSHNDHMARGFGLSFFLIGITFILLMLFQTLMKGQ